MQFDKLLDSEIQNFIKDNSIVSISKLALQKNPFPSIDYKVILNQIESRVKAKEKLPTWFSTDNIIYPNKISVEQTSSEITAKYKSEIVSGENLIDLTGGFGVDDFYFAKRVNHVIHCEINDELSKIAAHNFGQLKTKNIICILGDSSEILEQLNQKFSWIYIDPSRRSDIKGKVFMLKDSSPNVPELLNLYFKFSNNILIKTAPILDIKAGLLELKNVKNIHIVAVDNEVKELLWEIEKDFNHETCIKTINFNKEKTEQFEYQFNSNETPAYSLPEKYLYEPNSAIMKSGGFAEIGNKFSLKKLQLHSHLYTSNDSIDFPGRVFEIHKILNYSKSEMKQNFENKKANITVRNFPETVENIRKKWKIEDGGNHYCFFTTNLNNEKIVLLCTKTNLK